VKERERRERERRVENLKGLASKQVRKRLGEKFNKLYATSTIPVYWQVL
jgi:hypothetical protein